MQAVDAGSSNIDSSADFQGPASDVPIFDDEVVEEDSWWGVKDLTSKDDRGPTALQRVQDLCRIIGLSVPSDVLSVQRLVKVALAPFAFAGGDDACIADVKDSHPV